MDDDTMSMQARRERAEQIAAAHGHAEDELRMPWWAYEVVADVCAVATCDR